MYALSKKAPLFIEGILEWADVYRERTGDWPIASRGDRYPTP